MRFFRSLLLSAACLLGGLAGCASDSAKPTNPCSTANGGCDVNALCSDTSGVVTCSCATGYNGDGKTCEAVRYCTADNNPCDLLNASCTIEGGFPKCVCNEGFTGDGFFCKPRPRCAVQNGGCDALAGVCNDSSGKVVCSCKTDYQGDGYTCQALPKCAEDSCQEHADCSDADHTITCTCQAPNWVQDPTDAHKCNRLNNCVGYTQCGANSTCQPTTPTETATPICACKDGYKHTGDNNSDCRPFKTCATVTGTDACGADSTCVDTKDTSTPAKIVDDRTCKCNSGFSHPETDALACVDDNECLVNNGGCAANATCTNIPGGRTCGCPAGYSGDGVTCTPINVCTGSSNPCDATSSTCSFTGPNTHQCVCKTGYDTPTQTGCSLVNHCDRHTDNCDATSTTCSYTGPGTFTCNCRSDYENPTGTSCSEINLCSAGHTNSCVASTSTCHKTGANTYDCNCKNGFQHTTNNGQPDPYVCEDINECTSYGPNSTQTCSENAKCTNTVPGFTCTCNDGFFGTGSYSASGPTCLPRYTQVAVGNQHICALRADTAGTLVCWGANAVGQRGDGTPQTCAAGTAIQCLTTPQAVNMTSVTQWETNHGGASSWIKIAAGGDTTCGIRANGDLWCWGGNSYGQIGNNQKASIVALPTLVASGTKWSDISTETDHSFGVSTITGGNGQGFAWGQNMDYQLGTGDATEHLTPTAINLSAPPTGPNFWSIGAGYLHGCGLDTLGRIYCWGSNTYGQLGQPYDSSSPSYLPYTSTPTLIQVANAMGSGLTSTGSWDRYFPGYFSNCAMQADSTTSGSLWCWGSNVSGQLGDKTQTNRTQPVPVRNITNTVDSWWLGTVNNVPVQSVALGEAHTCGIKNDQSIACWGNNTSNQLGVGMGGPTTQLYPVSITLPAGLPSSMHFIRISARKSITCALSEDPGQVPQSDYDKRLFCWGGSAVTSTSTNLGYGPTPTEIKK